jgi:hypothetical protein
MNKTLTCLCAALVANVTTAMADIVYVTSLTQGCTLINNCPGANTDGTYSETGLNMGFTSAKGTASGRPVTPAGCRYYQASAFLTDTNAGVDISPTLGVAGGVYQIHYNFSSTAGNTSTNVILAATAVNGTLSFTQTDKFQRAYGNPANQWQFLGYLTNDPGSSTPIVQFRYLSGSVSAAGTGSAANRLMMDCWRFRLYQPCVDVPEVGVTGPLSTNSNQVVVTGVSASATNLVVYQDSGAGMVAIGTRTSGIVAGNNTVTVSGLIKTAQVAATQVINGQEGCVPAGGILVGGGANPSIRVAVSIRETPSTGPIGAPGNTTNTIIHFLGSSNVLAGGAPGGGILLTPGAGWQTVTFTRGNEQIANVASAAGVANAASGYAASDSVTLQVFAYRTAAGVRIYSATPAQSSAVTSNDVFAVNWTWSSVAGAEGYRLLRDLNGSSYTEFVDVATTSYSDDNTGWAAGSTVTPKIGQTDPSIQWSPSTGGTINTMTNLWGTLESINFAIDDTTDTGPYNLYIDNLQNGTTTFQDFELAPSGITDYGFRIPSFSGTTLANMLSAPDVGQVSNGAADTGTKSFLVRFQWSGTNSTRWLRLTTSSAGNPLVNLDQPISFRVLLLPVGATPTPPTAPALSANSLNGQTVLSWVGGHRLQTAVNVTGTYTNVPQVKSANVFTNVSLGAFLSPWTNNYPEPTRFFRLLD